MFQIYITRTFFIIINKIYSISSKPCMRYTFLRTLGLNVFNINNAYIYYYNQLNY